MGVDLDSQYALRDRLVQALENDLVGPREADETLVDTPFATYVASVLYPADAPGPPSEAEVDEADDGGETTYADPPVSLANTRYPASLGMTFAVAAGESPELRIIVDAARYEPEGDADVVWRRLPLRFEVTLPPASAAGQGEVELEAGLCLYHRFRHPDPDGVVPVTVVLINRRTAKAGKRDPDSYYQVRLSVDSDARPVFVERGTGSLPISDEDLESYRLIYRDVRSYAVGHGTSVEWDEHVDGARATRIATTPMPRHELLLADSNPSISSAGLSMRFLAEEDRADVVAGLRELCAGYREWIQGLELRLDALPPDLVPTAISHVQGCRTALGRMESGIRTLEFEDQPWAAFRLANRAMLDQRARAAWASDGRPSGGPVADDRHVWRPFQMAFILLNLDGIADGQHKDREMLDLLWFPTGGGKTEAYLGLIAFTILLRRLRAENDDGDGVTVLMRYTLRLLTIQQFERASGLICALELIRRGDSALGTRPISIGLWVGRAGTPSTIAETKAVLAKLKVGAAVETGNPMQLRSCPWCGTPLTHRAYWVANNPERLMITCRDKTCDFTKGLPISVVDEDIYRERPSLVIATADKFATLPWIKNGHRLFGLDESSAPPELIVQDELHLISGPLGTLAGLYESAIDILCTDKGVRPKVIASTATIRRARQQARALFDRDMSQFPPPGLDAGDSYFSETAGRDTKAARLYVGALAPGTSQSTLMIRTYAALMQAVYDDAAPPEVKDPYWTLLGYFNSLRVLGGARIQVLDDVRERIKVVAGKAPPRKLERNVELTSREASSDIPSHLDALRTELPSDDALDYVLATNMISVGVDIDRLGLMVVMGQPQATAEYIQATSRIGRRFPGLVVTLYNAGRSRDRSHYENFPTYHGALYRQVESTSVTPFSPRARDRALHAAFLSLARTVVPALRDGAGARAIEEQLDRLEPFVNQLAERAERVEHGSGSAVREELARIIERWQARNKDAPKLVYANPHDEVNSLLSSADQADGVGMATPSSLRDVDSESNLYLIRI